MLARTLGQKLSARVAVGFLTLESEAQVSGAGSDFWFGSGVEREAWLQSEVHRGVLQSVRESQVETIRSRKTWPFEALGEFVPGEVNILLPLSTQATISLESERGFSGYLFFAADVPTLAASQLFTELRVERGFLSACVAASLRASYESTELLAEYAHNVKHFLMVESEFRNALREIGTSEPEQLAKRNRILDRSERLSTRLLHETNEVLVAGRDASGSFRVSPIAVRVEELLDDVVEDLRPLFQSRGISVKSETSGKVPMLALDPALFPQVLENLLDNALKYCPEGGQVQIAVLNRDPGTVELKVANSGKSIPANERLAVFEPRVRGSNASDSSIPGNGLGLYVARRIVEAHGGEISVDEGELPTTFSITLPVDAVAEEDEQSVSL